jgi:hypothetical protein
MAGYLEEYGVADERRTKVIRWIVISAVVLAVGATAGYFGFRTYPARHRASVFLGDLSRHDYRAAYGDWGCAKGCADYPFDKFLEDWGPHSPFANAPAASIKKTRFCDTGVIVTLSSPSGADVPLWYERSEATLGFSPWPVCAPHIPAPQGAPSP